MTTPAQRGQPRLSAQLASVRALIAHPFREGLLLAGARAKVQGRPPEAQAAIRRWWIAARARLRVAEQLGPETEFAAAAALYRDGIPPLVAAATVAVERDVSPADVVDIRAAWITLERIWSGLGVGVDLHEFRSAKDALCNPPPVDEPPPSKAAAVAAYSEMRRLVSLLERAFEPRTDKRLAFLATVRQVALVVVVGLAIGVPARHLFAPRNLALNKPVQLSTVHPTRESVGGTPLVNGKIEFTYGAATDNTADGGRQDPWMMIDLERPSRIGKIVVYNRGDASFTDCLPLILEVGLDPANMKTVEVRKTLFTRTEPWVVDRLDETARYVRVRMTGTAYIALNEIEVYGR